MFRIGPLRSTRTPRRVALAWAIGAAFAASSSQAYVVYESDLGDAGQTQSTARATAGQPGALTHIYGSLLSSTDADLYIVNITDPMTFSAATRDIAGGVFDTQIFLLTFAGAPVYFNDDANGNTVLSALPAGSALGPMSAGQYLLGVANSGYNPANVNGQLLFATLAQDYLSTDVAGPTVGVQPAELGMFSDTTYDDLSGNSGAYDLQLTGVGAAVQAVPEPSTAALLLLGGALCAATVRRPRRATPVTPVAA